MRGKNVVDEDARTIGFRDANFTEQGFSLNGKVVKLRGLDRHQTFPFVGQAMPARVQKRDAQILRNELKCNIVRTSHYPQSRHFLDECDRIGLLVLEEIPGWQHIGDEAWQQISVDNVKRMIRRDWNRPVDYFVGRSNQRVFGQPQLLHADQCGSSQTRSQSSDGRHSLLPGFRVS